ncbi:23S rRNA (uracil(1939)-C(5))-methyltransferase RlmD [Cylindrospermopsis raciborskii]|uniref:23S rRNA (Uracil-5-)-methyltransferase RumA n=2 Tax=Cylindrospermopsis raciborskii TaxID=77022 RepID=A0A853MD16_9CYAN|nr:23S rRNA (uracil(1939)-C(5))-methyltransferase RlmD [Cylindrospermopsis raciborskii]EFA69371.1 23S rRNA methyltransferase/RumA [Cylindrospermopsis raciborskii CS-505]OBU75407.1 23S rRNA (uracil-5-)-methyltransferase RumA [Cylindrospermopsis raciborskii CS-505]OHY31609.1 23S rRNA (uracil-5-)-methyltransferase RumA [Cylindrospermopsis raciborskii CS-508]PNJ90598.1 23S rRNA (uracil-5-)-methyltransferase RumA [Cylindrospermopsis raciborskii C04]PNJ92143.1 23S rRNA (uracil-5-)-methyltransferase 
MNNNDIVWQQGKIIELEISDLNDNGEGVGRFEGRVVFVPDTVVGDRLLVRLLRVKNKYAHGAVTAIFQPSLQRTRPQCIVADKCGGCQWQHINYEYQLQVKQNQVIQALERIGNFVNPPVAPVLTTKSPLGYRNKATYPIKTSSTGQVQAGYYQKGSHLLINLNQCPVQDPRLNPLLTEIKQDIQKQGWSVYDENRHQGEIRHLGLRIGRYTGEILLTLVVKNGQLPGIETQAQQWLHRYPQLVGICLNHNGDRTNAIFGKVTTCIAGVPYLREQFAGLEFKVRPDTFFQVYTETAEALLEVIQSQLNLQGDEILVDAYCGIGTLTLPLAKQARQTIGLEIQPAAVEQAIYNAQHNGITNAKFQIGAVEDILPKLDTLPDIVLLDPPRKGCEPIVLQSLLKLKPKKIAYISCKASTLARDLSLLCASGEYKLKKVQPADFFPQTPHVETVAFLER